MNTLPMVFLVLIINSIYSIKLPSNLKKCTYGNPDLDECLARAVENTASLLNQPIPNIGLPNLEPLDIHSFSIGAGTGSVQVEEHFENAVLYGLRDVKVHEARFSLEDMSMNFSGLLPNLEIRAKYHASGKVLLLPIEGRGNATIKLTNITVVVHLPLEKVHKKGEIHLRVSSSRDVKFPKLDRLYMNLENLFNGNNELGDALNRVINENWGAIWDDVKNGWEKLFAEIIGHIFNRFFAKVPLLEMIDNVDPKILM